MNEKRPTNPMLTRKWYQFGIGAFFAFAASFTGALVAIKPTTLTELTIGLTIYTVMWISTGALMLWLGRAYAKRE